MRQCLLQIFWFMDKLFRKFKQGENAMSLGSDMMLKSIGKAFGVDPQEIFTMMREVVETLESASKSLEAIKAQQALIIDQNARILAIIAPPAQLPSPTEKD